MSGFSIEQMKQKLAKLNNTPESIQTLSLWILHHQKHHIEEIIQTWLASVTNEKAPPKIINLMYLANDAIQNCRRKNPEFAGKFFAALEPALRYCSKIPSPELNRAVCRIVEIFKTRQVYRPDKIQRLEQALLGRKTSIHPPVEEKPVSVAYNIEKIGVACSSVTDSLRKLLDPPSEDADTRHRLVDCPEVVGNPEKLDTISREEQAVEILKKLDELEQPAKEYCDKLTEEMSKRRDLQKELDILLAYVRTTIERQETLLKDVKRKEDNARHCVDEIKQIFEALPDLEGLSAGAPLPSADALFTSN